MNAFPEILSKSPAITQVASQLTGPINIDEFVQRVLTLWPTKAKNPKAGIRQTLQYDFLGKSLLFLDQQTLLPMRLAMVGVRFRVSLARQEIERGWLFVYPAFRLMVRQEVSPEDFSLEEADGRSIPVSLVKVKSKVKTIFGVQEYEHPAFDLKGWYKKHALRRGDSLLVTVLDWEAGRFRLEPDPDRLRQRHKTEIQTQNQGLAEYLFQQLETARYEEVWGQIAIPTAYLRLKAHNAYPPDHWLAVLEQDPRMRWTGDEIRYADRPSPLDEMFNIRGGPRPTASSRQRPLAKQEAQQVYRFKAGLWHNKSLWRQIEIQGGQTLADFDDLLRTAFQHDPMDHLSGFWQLVRRGESRRFREMDLGSINPFEKGKAANIQVASLSLTPGDAMKYVYDFGDWIQHRLELEAIVEPEENAHYPRITGQNKPRYRACQTCKQEGRKSVATWVCYTCSDEKQSAVLLCVTCMDAHDEDHYLEEILY